MRRFLRAGGRSIADLTDAEIDAALERGRAVAASETRAVSARHDAASGRVVVDLANGCTFAFPARRVQGLETATDEEIAAVELLPQGGGLRWKNRDVDISLPGLIAGILRDAGACGAAGGAGDLAGEGGGGAGERGEGRAAAKGHEVVAGRPGQPPRRPAHPPAAPGAVRAEAA